MKEQIIKIIFENPGLRKREIASYLGVHHFKIISLLNEMEQDGLITHKNYRDMANMEFYEKYYIRA